MNKSEQYNNAIQLIDSTYQQDPDIDVWNGEQFPKEHLYAQRMVHMLEAYQPESDEAQLLAARCQHLCRWEIPRSSYPMDKAGYHKWRTFLYSYQAGKAAELLTNAGYNTDTIERVKTMVSKSNLKTNPDSQLIEDVICLVFVKYYAKDFAKRYADNPKKLSGIINKTWNKMSPKAQATALKLDITPELTQAIANVISQ